MIVNIVLSSQKANILCEILKKLKLFTESFVLMINNERLYIQGLDASHIIIFDLHLSREWFETLDVNESENNFDFGLHTGILSKILNVKEDSQKMRIYNDEDSMDKLGIDFIEGNKNDYDKYFQIPLMDIDNDLLEIPETEYDASIVMETKSYKSIIDDFNGLEFNNIHIHCNDLNIKFSCEASHGNMDICVKESQIYSYEVIEDTEIINCYNLNFLSKICQFKISKYISIQQSKGIPIEIKYLLNPDDVDVDNSDNYGNIEKLTRNWFKFYLAPCTDDDEF